jgi:tRNA A-37 threonylcarbamoyl transferase component Bud32
MNAAGFVHGDLRPPNVLVPKNNGDPLILLDFDWGGQDSVTRYPGNLNIAIQRHDTVRNGGVIEAVHDRFMLDRLFS